MLEYWGDVNDAAVTWLSSVNNTAEIWLSGDNAYTVLWLNGVNDTANFDLAVSTTPAESRLRGVFDNSKICCSLPKHLECESVA